MEYLVLISAVIINSFALGESPTLTRMNESPEVSCNLNGVAGTCMDYHQCTGYSSPLNLCPGPDNIQCCLPKLWGSCTLNGVTGTCVDYHYCTGTSSTANLCPGPDDIRCCIPSSPPPPPSGLINVPLVCQLPELKNGCEVTSLTMLLQWAGIKVDKMTLASEVKKDPTPYSNSGGVIHWGNPNVGFVGDITGKSIGFAVYHGPILDLALRYHKAVNLTGQSFDQVLTHVAAGSPVWVITTFSFEFVPESQWQTVISPEGAYRMTFNEHSVVLTGFDAENVYINDPYANIKDRKLNRANFLAGWQQFGNQAIVLVN